MTAPAKTLMRMLESATMIAVSGRERPTVPADAGREVAAPELEAAAEAPGRELLPVVRADVADVGTEPCRRHNQHTSVISMKG
jgi:hypothetical protein